MDFFEKLIRRNSRRALRRLAGDENLELLRSLPMMKGFSATGLLALHERLIERHYQADEVIFTEESPGVCLFLVKRGEVEVFSQANGGERVVYSRIGRGTLFGEISIITLTYRSASARALSHGCCLLGLTAYDVQIFLENHPRDGLRLLRGITERITDTLVDTNRRLNEAEQELRRLRQLLGDHED